jgi:hypothetical protein
MMTNLRYDTKSFRPMFDHALASSTIRKPSRARDDKNLAETFQNQVDAMVEIFKKVAPTGSQPRMPSIRQDKLIPFCGQSICDQM